MEQFIELLKEVNIVQIFIIFACGWMFYNRLDKKIEKVEDRISLRMTKIENDMQTIQTHLEIIQNTLIEIKWVLGMKECCMINEDKKTKKSK